MLLWLKVLAVCKYFARYKMKTILSLEMVTDGCPNLTEEVRGLVQLFDLKRSSSLITYGEPVGFTARKSLLYICTRICVCKRYYIRVFVRVYVTSAALEGNARYSRPSTLGFVHVCQGITPYMSVCRSVNCRAHIYIL